ncbi:MAG: hypothetical protein HY537_02440 [Deltaproteobacteria bacterium]|nr:hypothetical protein [Deltaproteobacteria bacterium]
MKRLWVLALVFVLALSLTSCGKGKPKGGGSVVQYCDGGGTLGTFDLWMTPSPSDPNSIKVVLVPVNVVRPGDIVDAAVYNEDNWGGQQEPLKMGFSVFNNQPVFLGYLTQTQLMSYNALAIYTSGYPSFPEAASMYGQNNSNVAYANCGLPMVGNPVTSSMGGY